MQNLQNEISQKKRLVFPNEVLKQKQKLISEK